MVGTVEGPACSFTYHDIILKGQWGQYHFGSRFGSTLQFGRYSSLLSPSSAPCASLYAASTHFWLPDALLVIACNTAALNHLTAQNGTVRISSVNSLEFGNSPSSTNKSIFSCLKLTIFNFIAKTHASLIQYASSLSALTPAIVILLLTFSDYLIASCMRFCVPLALHPLL